MGLEGPSRSITVEPLEVPKTQPQRTPEPAPAPEKAPAPEPVKEPEREKVPA